ncbi:SMP-30/gluconolactonase/LRE family protein [Nocardia yamanashiensis]|uniref:SMP-30/gluconolactonase/LRE family protein n=1 Tax=Nocardia yamanashiensis TaxID=209247 RepID=UPI00083792DE|nr:SMP-30/gluconolactonase/LRE family protein [Nocardia yamanashiensis]
MRGKRLAVLLVLCAAGCAVRQGDIEVPGTTTADGNAAVTAPAPVAKTAVLEGFSAPESVYFVGDRVFVSNLGTADRSAKDGDGFLSELTPAGAVVEPKALPREGDPVLDAPKGMAHIGNRLYVADVDRIVGYDMDTREQVFEATMSTARLLNGLAVLNPTTLLVTDTLASSLYRLDLDSRQFALVADGMSGANGIALDPAGQVAYVAAMGVDFGGGNVYRLDLAAAPVTPVRVGTLFGIHDGMAVRPNGDLVVSDWVSTPGDEPGTVTVYDPEGIALAPVAVSAPLHGPTGFALDPDGLSIWIPSQADNRVVLAPLPATAT